MTRSARPLTLALVVAASAGAGACGSSLPSTRPADFTVQYDEGGGMLPRWQTFTCRAGGCVYERREMQNVVRAECPATDAQIEQLYATLRAHAVDRMSSREEREVYDRGGTSLRVTAGTQHVEVSDRGRSFVRQTGDYRAVTEAIEALMAPCASRATPAAPAP